MLINLVPDLGRVIVKLWIPVSCICNYMQNNVLINHLACHYVAWNSSIFVYYLLILSYTHGRPRRLWTAEANMSAPGVHVAVFAAEIGGFEAGGSTLLVPDKTELTNAGVRPCPL